MTRTGRLLAAAVLALAGLTALVGPAAALPRTQAGSVAAADVAADAPAVQVLTLDLRREAPFRLPSPLTDRNGSLGSSTAQVQNSLDKLQNEDKVQLWVVYVDSFSGTPAQSWAEQTFNLSDLGSKDALLAIATVDRSYYLGANGSFPLSSSQLDSIGNNSVKPLLSKSDWPGAAIAAADAMRSTIGGSSSTGSGGSGLVWFVVILLVIGVGVFFWLRSRRKKSTAAGGAQGTEPNAPPAQPVEPYEELSARSVQILIDTDNAVRTSEAQLGLAEQTFGAAAVADFRTSFEQARQSLAEAFQLRQQIDDDEPEDEATRRAWMGEIIDRCQAADASLEAQSERFDDLLDIKNRLPAVLAAMPAEIDAQQARIPTATAALQRLGQQFAPTALSTVAGNAEEATARLEFARVTAGQAGAADPTQAAITARSAQEAVTQATTLLDAVDKLDAELAAAVAQLPSHLAPVQAELAQARTTFGQSATGEAGTTLSQRLDQVQAALTAVAGPAGTRDPILALQRIREADEALDVILADTRTAQQNQARASQALASALRSAQNKVSTAEDYVTTRRGAIGSEARTRVAEAHRHLDQAGALAESDPATALAEAHQAESLADEAIRLAQDDVGGFGGGGFGGGSGRGGNSNFGAAVLGGILGGMLSGGGGHRNYGGFGGGFGGGFSGGGGGGFGGGGGGGGFGGGGGRF